MRFLKLPEFLSRFFRSALCLEVHSQGRSKSKGGVIFLTPFPAKVLHFN